MHVRISLGGGAGVGRHAAGSVDSVAIDAEARVLGPDHARADGARVEPDPDSRRAPVRADQRRGGGDHLEGDGEAFARVVDVGLGAAADREVDVVEGLDLADLAVEVAGEDAVEEFEDAVEPRDHRRRVLAPEEQLLAPVHVEEDHRHVIVARRDVLVLVGAQPRADRGREERVEQRLLANLVELVLVEVQLAAHLVVAQLLHRHRQRQRRQRPRHELPHAHHHHHPHRRLPPLLRAVHHRHAADHVDRNCERGVRDGGSEPGVVLAPAEAALQHHPKEAPQRRERRERPAHGAEEEERGDEEEKGGEREVPGRDAAAAAEHCGRGRRCEERVGKREGGHGRLVVEGEPEAVEVGGRGCGEEGAEEEAVGGRGEEEDGDNAAAPPDAALLGVEGPLARGG
eukprot:931564-Rhodomonas_salina.1